MVVAILVGLFMFCCFLLGVLVMIQQGKGDMGLGALHTGTQTLFGGSGGQTFFQKLTWAFGVVFLTGSLGLTVLKMRQLDSSRIIMSQTAQEMPQQGHAEEPAAEAEQAAE